MGKGLGWILGVIGVALVGAGLIVMLAVVPGMKKMPSDTDTTRDYEGTMNVLLDPADFTFQQGLPISLQRHFFVVESQEDVALVKEEKTMTAGGQPLQQVTTHYAVDRTTMLATDEIPDDWSASEGFIPRQGIVLSWPIDTEQKDYMGWSDDYMSSVPLTFVEEARHERSGLTLYKFTSSSDAQPMNEQVVQGMGLPAALPKEQLALLLGQAGIEGQIADLLPELVAQLPASVPLGYSYAYEGTYWIDPATGIIVDTEKHETRTVGLSPDALEGTALALLPAEQQAALRVPVMDFEYAATDASVDDAKADAEDAGDRLQLYGTILPIAAIVLGGVLLLIGIVLIARRKRA